MVYICNSAKDSEYAVKVVRELEQAGFETWISPRNISPGASWADAVIQGIEAASTLLLILSPSANTSPQVGRELWIALQRGIPILILKIGAEPPSAELKFLIGSSACIEVNELGVETFSVLLRGLSDIAHRSRI